MRTASLMLVLLVASCTTVETSVVDSNLTLDFSRFHTYAWGPRGGAPSGAEVDRQVEDAIDAQLLAHGLVRVHAPADLEVRFYVSVDREMDEQVWGGSRGARWAGSPDTHVRELSVGAIVVDVFDLQSKQLAWRGVGKGELAADASPEERARQIREGAAQLFARFPARK
jgi:hypothetical protein